MNVRVYTSADYALESSTPNFFLEPIMYSGSLCMLFAGEGVGKSYLSMYLAASACSGEPFLTFKPHKKSKVFYIDGEMSTLSNAKRHQVLQSNKRYTFANGLYRSVCCNSFPKKICPQLSIASNHDIYHQLIGDAEIIIIDNLNSLCTPQYGQTELQAFEVLFEWLMRLRNEGRAVLMVHHTNKMGDQSGSIRKMQPLDTALKLVRPIDYKPGEALRCNLFMTKDRDCLAPDFGGLEISLNPTTHAWDYKSLEEKQKELIITQTKLGASIKDIAFELNLHPFMVRGILNANKEVELEDYSSFYGDD